MQRQLLRSVSTNVAYPVWLECIKWSYETSVASLMHSVYKSLLNPSTDLC